MIRHQNGWLQAMSARQLFKLWTSEARHLRRKWLPSDFCKPGPQLHAEYVAWIGRQLRARTGYTARRLGSPERYTA